MNERHTGNGLLHSCRLGLGENWGSAAKRRHQPLALEAPNQYQLAANQQHPQEGHKSGPTVGPQIRELGSLILQASGPPFSIV